MLPKSRIVVTVSIEGTKHTMLLDTGASDVTVRSSVFSSLTQDGRATMTAGTVETVSGTSRATMTRTRSVVLDGVEVDGVVVLGDAATDMLFESVSQEVGQTVDGSLGGNFLNQFYLTIDYAGQTLAFARYTDTSFIIDPAERLGFMLGRATDGTYKVASVVAKSDAANQGVHVGDAIVAVDGAELAGASVSQILARMSGVPGTTKLVTFGTARSLAGQTVAIQVSELLPLP
jgi:membrane-associated protease RseP (regulator of RpoE activity)